MASSRRVCVVGSGPNGLAAAIVFAQAGWHVEVFEAQPTVGGGARTTELTLPGFHHDVGSAVHPMAAGSPFFASLPLGEYGLEWVHSPAPLAHPLHDGTAVMLERDLGDAESALGVDGKAWVQLIGPFAEHWWKFAPEVLQPQPTIPLHPFLMARFGMNAFLPASVIARRFHSERTRALFAGIAAHSFMSLDQPLSGAFGILLSAPAHAVGWPIPRGGSQSITNALSGYLESLGGKITTNFQVEKLSAMIGYNAFLCDVTPKQLVQIADDRLRPDFKERLRQYRYGPGVFKVDYALSEPIPWKAAECRRAATVHLGGSFGEIAASELAMKNGEHAERPFVLLSQPTLFDGSRAPEGKHIAWTYCHVPRGSTEDMLNRVENQIERFAPGFRDCVLARKVSSPLDLEGMNANLVGGDIGGGAMDIRNILSRPTWRHYGTSARDVYICSSSTPPGAGVHGMCGYHAARLALARLH